MLYIFNILFDVSVIVYILLSYYIFISFSCYFIFYVIYLLYSILYFSITASYYIFAALYFIRFIVLYSILYCTFPSSYYIFIFHYSFFCTFYCAYCLLNDCLLVFQPMMWVAIQLQIALKS